MSWDKLLMFKKYFKENLIKDFIWVSSSLITALILFVRKLREELCLCVDYWELNNIIIKNYYSLSLIWETLNWLLIAKFFIKLDIITVFNHLHVKESKKWKTAFLTHYELYKFLVLSFELHNTLIKFQSYINKIL